MRSARSKEYESQIIMTSTLQSPLPNGTTTRLNFSSGQTISVQDFLRGLRKLLPSLIQVELQESKIALKSNLKVSIEAHLEASVLKPPGSCPLEQPRDWAHELDSSPFVEHRGIAVDELRRPMASRLRCYRNPHVF